jgi:steroid 5-alpha reductase family enzyme
MSLIQKLKNVLTFPVFMTVMLMRMSGWKPSEERRKEEEDYLDYRHRYPN